jgi:tetratricopeptide (TPR) repeat protein
MADDIENPGSSAAGGSSGGGDPAAIAVALSQPATLDPRAAAFLEKQGRLSDKQSRLVDLQIEDLMREDKLRHWSLRIRHISDVLKLGFELAAGALVTILVVFVLGAVWNAAHDDGLVIEAFNVPADMAANGLSGQVIATQIQDHLAWMQANTDTIRQANTFRNNFGDDIKVQIPDTGISIGEFYRYLAGWLGHQTHITGEVWRTPNGLSLSVRVGGQAKTYQGAMSDFQALVGKGAEQIYWQTQPYSFSAFVSQHGRDREGIALFKQLALHGAPEDRPWAYSRLGTIALTQGDAVRSLQLQQTAAALNPDLPHVWANLGNAEAYFGHDEAAVRATRRATTLLLDPRTARQLAAYAVNVDVPADQSIISEYYGDYRDAVAQEARFETMPVYSQSDLSARLMMSADLAMDHDIAGSARAGRDTEANSLTQWATVDFEALTPPLPDYERAVARGEWRTARDDLMALTASPVGRIDGVVYILPVWIWPRLALTQARLGDFAAASALIDRTPRDCYLCVTVRGEIAAAAKNWTASAAWFEQAQKLGPSFPFANTDWGAMLMAKGDLDGAIAKFTLANQKGPHFADPLEMWGEALIAKNRSDLALAKFADANKYAPNWGRLHLKWGEALLWSGDKDGARKQFAVASGLDLTAVEKAQLARVRA